MRIRAGVSRLRIRPAAWARQLFEATAPYASGSVYINFMPDDENDRVEKAYGPNYRRLTEIKRRYDPNNLFRVNQNIAPAPEAPEGKRRSHANLHGSS